MKFSPSLSFCLCLLVLSSCSKVTDMHNATMDMNKSTAAMNATTSKLAGTTEDTKALMAEIYDSGRQGAALDLRNKLWDTLVKSPKIEEKATNAGLYMIAFEYQLWNKLGTDSLKDQRDRLMKDAADEFFCHLLSISHWTQVDPFAMKNPLKMGEEENEKAAFNAIAMVLEKTNRKEEVSGPAADGEAHSMRKMIEMALIAGKQIKEGKAKLSDFPAYVEVILSHEDEARRLIEARQQMLGLAVLTQLTPIGMNTMEGFKLIIMGQNWDLDFDKLNSSQVRLADFRLKEAVRARGLMEKLGSPVELNSTIKAVYSHARVKNARTPREAGSNAAMMESVQAQNSLLGTLGQYVGGEFR